MERILDRQNNPQSKSSWKPVLITNGIILFILFYFCYHLFVLETGDISYQIEDIIINSFIVISVWVVIVNIIGLFISLFFSKTYWRKWLVVVACGVIIFISILVIRFIIDFDKIIN